MDGGGGQMRIEDTDIKAVTLITYNEGLQVSIPVEYDQVTSYFSSIFSTVTPSLLMKCRDIKPH